MKWLVIIAILIVIGAAMVWLRMVREGHDTTGSHEQHRRDDSVMPPASPGLRLDTPPSTTPADRTAESGPEVVEEPDSGPDIGPGTVPPDEPGPRDDLPPSQTRPQA
ncbi:hypothetical protein [Aeromicrobium sp.]|uniref:hypothetical protein n=1 Tax=Aeromicrobium sp. TaxID=1871063 RepID=UPI002FC65124